MPPFVPPPNPPAQIQPVVANPQGQPLEALIQRHSPIVSPIKSGTSGSLLANQVPDLLSPTPPQVVEFYLSDPQDIPTPSLSPTLPPTEGAANVLGNPISVGESASAPSSKPSPILIPWTQESSQPIPQISETQSAQQSYARRLVIQQRGESPKEFRLPTPSSRENKTPNSLSQRQFEIFPELTPKTNPGAASETTVGVVELISDRQEYDSEREVVYAEGNVVMRFANGVLLADRLWINLPDQFAVAEGNVVLDRGDQTLRGERFEYYFVQDSGVIFNANGEIYQPTTGRDFAPTLPSAADNALIPNQTLNERLAVNQPLQRITTAEGIKYSFGLAFGAENAQGISGNTGQGSGGQINRIRFEAERMEFDADGWRATNARLSNDPFSPPEVEIRAETATYRNIAPLVDEVKLTNSRVVLDQKTSFPTQDRLIIDQRDRQPGVIGFGYDDFDRGGFFVERGFNVIDTDFVRWQVTPQYYLQKGVFPDSLTTDDPNSDLYLENEDDIDAISPPTFGFTTEFNANFDARTSLFARTSLTSLEFSDIEDRLRTKTFVQHRIGDLARPHDLRFEYNYRERLFNGSLGFQTVRSSAGLIVVSPQILLDTSGLQLSYQGSIQSVNADTDRASLLGSYSEDNRVTLMRFQGAASLNRPFLLWYGEALPPTPEEGLKYSPTPVLPFLVLSTGVTGVTSLYGNGDSQPSLSGTIGLSGQIGHFSRPFLDYTGFNLSFSQALRGDPSPFLFDRYADLKTLTWGLTQQLYGPVRFGVQSAYNIDTDEEINTDLFLEYSRRTYSILLRYNTVLKVGSLSLRISDFNWGGNPGPFDGTGIRPVIQGVPR
ncbi:DUF3769 domain-containing protein [Crocosphaera sp. UHCC 0190]|uniref:DUF3769 domain-containing protein n=1 Tax=Crocosphaera sp. UHCC 0190 TaxID=3110246 RepID=UPI002B216613|nr:DUF3769 domain-containing protein [Crocosphaera sp. UHCC 0190]MEA5511053.1 DUF3769 domain-containing protein [Crocosphaera sp. UHCC 0190]